MWVGNCCGSMQWIGLKTIIEKTTALANLNIYFLRDIATSHAFWSWNCVNEGYNLLVFVIRKKIDSAKSKSRERSLFKKDKLKPYFNHHHYPGRVYALRTQTSFMFQLAEGVYIEICLFSLLFLCSPYNKWMTCALGMTEYGHCEPAEMPRVSSFSTHTCNTL